MTEPKLRVLSLGAGVQSTTMALMAAHGEFEHMPDCAIFADTGAEPRAVMDHLSWLMSDNVLPYPVHIVQKSNLYDDIMRGVHSTGHRFASIPFHGISDKGPMMARRQCTSEYKISPIRKKVVEILGGHPKGGCEMWIGISTDEILRAKSSNVQYITHRHPLIDKGMNRWDCLQWMSKNGYPKPTKSSCTFCPFHSNFEWRWLRDNDVDGWNQAVEVDRALRLEGATRFNSKLFLHKDRVPLDEADIRTSEEHGQPDMFNNECEGMCGV